MSETYRLLLDENTEFEALAGMLSKADHDVETLKTASSVGLGASDTDIAAYSRATGRAIVTYDDDFTEYTDSPVEPRATAGVLFIEDERLSPAQVAYIIDTMSNYLSPSEYDQSLVPVGREWLAYE